MENEMSVQNQPLIKVLTIQRKHINQIITPKYDPDNKSLYMQTRNAVKQHRASIIGWFWNDSELSLKNENGHGPGLGPDLGQCPNPDHGLPNNH